MSKQNEIESISSNVEDSMGVRGSESNVDLSPSPRPKDSGRRPLRSFGTVPVDQVQADSEQPRKRFDEASLEELASSIRSKGQLQPIRVRWSDDENSWVIVAGERRWRAAAMAGLANVDCYFHEDELTESEILEEQIIENLHRRSLKPVEEAKSFARLIEINNWNGKQLAKNLAIHPTKVSRSLALLKLPDDIQQQIEDGQLPARTAYELSKIKGDNRRQIIAEQSNQNLTSQQTAKKVRQRLGKKAKSRGRTHNLTFHTTSGWLIRATRKQSGNYHEVEEALNEALEEVRLRIENNVRLF